jgi:thymidylate synthase
MHIITENPSEALELATQYVIEHGDAIAPRNMVTLELLNVTLQVQKPWNLPLYIENRKLNQNIGIKEALQLVGQITDPESILETTSVFGRFMDDNILYGSYGPRIHGNLGKLVNQLKKDYSTRQAVLTIFDSDKDLNADVKDVPCTLTLQYFIRDNRLLARTSMRSNDVFLGLPYDLTQFIALQGAIAKALDVEMGSYTHTVGSMHIYEEHIPQAQWIKSYFNGSYRDYEPMWSGKTIGEISQSARNMLKGKFPENMTQFERFLAGKSND